MSHRPAKQNPINQARRHFFGFAAATVGKAAAAAALAATALSSSANANNGKKLGWDIGVGNPHGGARCFLKGTRILTVTGEVPVEELRIGDVVETVSGETMPIKWIGRDIYRKSGISWHKSVKPIRISRFALDERTPHADLYLSPGHAILVNDILVPVLFLENGISVVASVPQGMEIIEYFQIVLETHDVIWAEGAPAETFLDATGKNYEHFTNFAEYNRLYPNEPCPTIPYRPRVRAAGHLKALIGLGLSPFVDIYDPFRAAYSRIAARAEELTE
jgi:hypothetical protein